MRRNNTASRKILSKIRLLINTPRIAVPTLVAAVGAIALLLYHSAPPSNMSPPLAGAVPTSAPLQNAARIATAMPVVQQAGMASSLVEVIVGRNDTLDSIFRRLSLNLSDLAAIRNLPGIRQSLDFLKPGDAIRVTHSSGDIRSLTRKVSETRLLTVVREDEGFTAKMTDTPVDTRVRIATASIDSSLFQAAESTQMSDTIALKLAAIFAWDIDFVLDIRQGDRFTVEYEQVYQDGKYLRDGDVLAAEFVNNGRTYRAVRFLSESGSAGYYTPDGRPMRKAFLRAPVDFTRVSSAFNPHRRHPILNTIRGHMGTDYAAPSGTPVHAAGDGRVSFAGTKGGYGNCIMVAHGSSVSTLYGHLSRFARTAHIGAHVQQGDVIGYVGMTGLATGPHLHYEYLINGVHKNPQTVQLPGAEPLHAQMLQAFKERTAPLLAALSAPAAPPPSAVQSSAAPPVAPAATGTALAAAPGPSASRNVR